MSPKQIRVIVVDRGWSVSGLCRIVGTPWLLTDRAQSLGPCRRTALDVDQPKRL